MVVPSKSCSLESKSFNSTLHSMYIRAGLHHTPGPARVVLVGYRFNTVCFVLCVLKDEWGRAEKLDAGQVRV